MALYDLVCLVETSMASIERLAQDIAQLNQETIALEEKALDQEVIVNDMVMKAIDRTAMCAVRPSTVPPRTVIIDTGSMGDVPIDYRETIDEAITKYDLMHPMKIMPTGAHDDEEEEQSSPPSPQVIPPY